MRQVLALPPSPRTRIPEKTQEYQELLLVEDDTTENITLDDVAKEAVNENDKVKEAESLPAPDGDMEARFGLLEAIITSQSQTLPDFSGRINMDSNDTELSSDEEEVISFSCHKCQFNVKSAATLLAHKKDSHSDIYRCQLCHLKSQRRTS